MKRIWRNTLLVAILAVMIAAGGLLAQPAGTSEAKSEDGNEPDILLPAEQRAPIAPRDMLRRSESLIEEMKLMLERVIAIQQVARKQKDVIRLNCVNDRLLQVKKLLNIAEASRNDLVEAIAAENETERYHQFTKVTISYEKISVLRDEAEACVGEELVFLGPTEVVVDRPPIIDDPTTQDPFVLTDEGIERPAFASPFL